MSEKTVQPVTLESLLKRLSELDGSDLMVMVGSPPKVQVNDRHVALFKTPLTPEQVETILAPLIKGRERQVRNRPVDIDVAYSLGPQGRYRINVYRQRGYLAFVARRIRFKVPNVKELGLPRVLKKMALLKHGLILVTGAAGTGKSTTLAAMVDHRNTHSSGHIVTIEDPIEYTHPHKGCLVSQREIGTDTPTYALGMKSALRQAPAVVLIGEIRDRETAEAALHVSETGHLVMSTLHAINAAQALDRFADLFEKNRRQQIMALLSLELGGIISQRLVPTKDRKRRVAALEVLVPTPRIRELIAAGDIEEVTEAMVEASGAEGIQTFEDALYKYYCEGKIRFEEAIAYADSPANLRLRIHLRHQKGQSGKTKKAKIFKLM